MELFAIAVILIWLVISAYTDHQRAEVVERRLRKLEYEMSLLRDARLVAPPSPAPVAPAKKPEPEIAAFAPEAPKEPAALKPQPPPPRVEIPRIEPEPGRSLKTPLPKPSINWEQFMGVKLFAWVGGLALFFGIALFVKYSFDNNLISPALRMAIGFIAGLAMLCGGVVLTRKNYQTLSQTMCATGVAILYAVTFACHTVYRFEFFGTIPTFLLMALITTTAFLLAVKLHAKVVAILGMVGGFLTPILLSTGQDNPLGLFGYVAILDAGLIVVALHRRWHFLFPMAAAGTAIMEVGWAQEFFEAGSYFQGSQFFIPLTILLGFTVLFSAAVWWSKRRDRSDPWIWGSAVGLAIVALAFAGWFLTFDPIAQRPWILFGFVFCVDLAVAGIVVMDGAVAPTQPGIGIMVFALLAAWTLKSLSNDLLTAGLTFYLLFAIFHSIFPILMQRLRNLEMPSWSKQVFPPVALLLVLLPIFQLPEVSFWVWPFILMVDLLAILIAATLASILPAMAVLLLTFSATGVLILRIPTSMAGLSTSFILLGSFAVFFVAAGVFLALRFRTTGTGEPTWSSEFAGQLPAASAGLPFLLLILATWQLRFPDPSPLFGLALLLVLLLLGVARLFRMTELPAVGLLCVTALELTWHFAHFSADSPMVPLIWYLGFYALFAIFPFLFIRRFGATVVPFAVAALSAVPQFFLVYRLVKLAFPNHVMGLIPAAFAVPLLVSLVGVLKMVPESRARLSQVAWFGGVALFFITLIFPIQLEREWITIGWALEGMALLWLFHRVPHGGLQAAGTGLLIAAFVRLTLNPAVLAYHPRSATPIFNWYLYTYGIVTTCLFAATRLLGPPRDRIQGVSVQPLIGGLGTTLAFFLLNIEIADFFSPVGSTLTFDFTGSFGRDMTYSIAWALFALVLLLHGILKNNMGSRYAALGLLSVTVLKLFFHDLAELDQLYRIAAFVAVAVIAMMASFAYQRFFASHAENKEPTHENVP